jgi:hypothetical protein
VEFWSGGRAKFRKTISEDYRLLAIDMTRVTYKHQGANNDISCYCSEDDKGGLNYDAPTYR